MKLDDPKIKTIIYKECQWNQISGWVFYDTLTGKIVSRVYDTQKKAVADYINQGLSWDIDRKNGMQLKQVLVRFI